MGCRGDCATNCRRNSDTSRPRSVRAIPRCRPISIGRGSVGRSAYRRKEYGPRRGDRVCLGGRAKRLISLLPALVKFRERRKPEVQLWRVHHGRTSGSVELHSWVATLGQQGTEPWLRVCVVSKC